jgi:hypothetical protein
MGLKIHSLAELPEAVNRGYYVYLLDYGWEEPLGKALRNNFDRMAGVASRHNAAVLLGLGDEFNDEVLSWHRINGEDADDLLPAVLITNKHPAHFARMHGSWNRKKDHLVLIPLRGHCKNTTDVAALIDGIFRDIKAKKPLMNFSVASKHRGGIGRAIIDAVVLKPTVAGMGIDLKELVLRFTKRGRNRA